MNYYIHGIGSTCYNQTGITFPVKIDLPFETIIREFFPESNIIWEPYLNRSNQPDVCVFSVPNDVTTRHIKALESALSEYYNRIHVWEYQEYEDPFDNDLRPDELGEYDVPNEYNGSDGQYHSMSCRCYSCQMNDG